MSMRISKTKFCAGVQCLKRLYLLVHEPELAAKIDAASEAIMAQGREVGLLARQLFPNGTEVDITGFRAKSGESVANGRSITLPDGRELFSGGSGPGENKSGENKQ